MTAVIVIITTVAAAAAGPCRGRAGAGGVSGNARAAR